MSSRIPHRPHGVGTPPHDWPTGRLISAVARRLERTFDAYLGDWGLSHASLPALAVLSRSPSSQRALAAALGVTEQTTSRIVDGLVRSGYVLREPDPDDGRRHLLVVTEHGRAALVELDDPVAVAALVEHDLSPGEEDTLRALLLRLLPADRRQL